MQLDVSCACPYSLAALFPVDEVLQRVAAGRLRAEARDGSSRMPTSAQLAVATNFPSNHATVNQVDKVYN